MRFTFLRWYYLLYQLLVFDWGTYLLTLEVFIKLPNAFITSSEMCSLDALLVNSSSLTLPLCSKLLIVAELGSSPSRRRTKVLLTFLDLGRREDCSDTDMLQELEKQAEILEEMIYALCHDIARYK